MPRRAIRCTSRSCSRSSIALSTWRHYLQGAQVQGADRSQVAAVLQDAAACSVRPPVALEGRHRQLRLRHRVHRRARPTSSPMVSRVDRITCSTARSCCMLRSVDVDRLAAGVEHRSAPPKSLASAPSPSLLGGHLRGEQAATPRTRRLLKKSAAALEDGAPPRQGWPRLLSRPRACTSRTTSRCGLVSCRSATTRPPAVTSARTRPSSR